MMDDVGAMLGRRGEERRGGLMDVVVGEEILLALSWSF